MAIAVNVDQVLIAPAPQDCNIDLANLKLRLALEGVEITTPVHGNLIRISHPQHGMTHFNSWGTILDHCNENWKTTYWGIPYKGSSIYSGVNPSTGTAYLLSEGGLNDADSSPGADSSGSGVPVSTPL